MRALHRLSKSDVRTITRPGWYPDGGCLHLLVGPSGSKSWVFRYTHRGCPHYMGFGGYPTFSLDEARERANKQRKLLADGLDPLTVRRKEQQRIKAIRTFQDCAVECIAVKSHGWKNEKHAWQWEQTLKAHVYPRIGVTPVAEVDVETVVSVLRPIWRKMPETAARVRSRIENILDYAAVKGYRPKGENPARWDGNVEFLLPSRGEMAKAGRVAGVKHHTALPYGEVPAFMAALHAREARTWQTQITALAVEFVILTAARSGEVRGATIHEFDYTRNLWIIPASRMKSHREHIVPIGKHIQRVVMDAALHPDTPKSILKDDRVFAVSDTAMRRLCRQTAGKPITLHGFRSSFRDWCAETGVRRELAEAALAHTIKDKTEAAYARSTLVEQRREVMERWWTFIYSGAN